MTIRRKSAFSHKMLLRKANDENECSLHVNVVSHWADVISVCKKLSLLLICHRSLMWLAIDEKEESWKQLEWNPRRSTLWPWTTELKTKQYVKKWPETERRRCSEVRSVPRCVTPPFLCTCSMSCGWQKQFKACCCLVKVFLITLAQWTKTWTKPFTQQGRSQSRCTKITLWSWSSESGTPK